MQSSPILDFQIAPFSLTYPKFTQVVHSLHALFMLDSQHSHRVTRSVLSLSLMLKHLLAVLV